MQILIDKGLVSREEIDEMIEEAYLPYLKMLSYSIDEDESGITIYSHAPIGLSTMSDLANKLELVGSKINFNKLSMGGLTDLIDDINLEVQKNRFCDLIENEPLIINHGSETRPILFTLWNRIYDILKNEQPSEHPIYKFKIRFCFGHDANGPLADNLIQLDKNNSLGKTAQNNKGPCVVFFSQEKTGLSLEVINPAEEKTEEDFSYANYLSDTEESYMETDGKENTTAKKKRKFCLPDPGMWKKQKSTENDSSIDEETVLHTLLSLARNPL